MAPSGGRRIIYSSLLLLLIISVLNIWVFSDSQVVALRLLQEDMVAREQRGQTMKKDNKNAVEGDALLQNDFNGGVPDLNNTTQHGFQENKRTIPSCPDALHNK
ncbi:unnamed protein product [Ilex paraguariensis]|uniref:Uncharacterized protein n=1 Tax=Ilex paraguariensis TaxID=185542 RepID=A0ABC8SXQ2_9AQUA